MIELEAGVVKLNEKSSNVPLGTVPLFTVLVANATPLAKKLKGDVARSAVQAGIALLHIPDSERQRIVRPGSNLP